MNKLEIPLNGIEVPRSQCQEALRVLLNTIFYLRSIQRSNLSPLPLHVSIFGKEVAHPSCDPEINRLIEQRIKEFYDAVKQQALPVVAKVHAVLFTNTSVKKMIGSREEKIIWEDWIIPITVHQDPPNEQGTRRFSELADVLRDRVLFIVSSANKDWLNYVSQSRTREISYDIHNEFPRPAGSGSLWSFINMGMFNKSDASTSSWGIGTQ